MKRQRECPHRGVVETLYVFTIDAQVQLSGQQAFDTQDVQGALLYKLHALACQVA